MVNLLRSQVQQLVRGDVNLGVRSSLLRAIIVGVFMTAPAAAEDLPSQTAAVGEAAQGQAVPAATAAAPESGAAPKDNPPPLEAPAPPPEGEGGVQAEAGAARAPGAYPAAVDAESLAVEVRAKAAGIPSNPALLEPPLPNEEAFDWLCFDSGEWVGGDLKEIRDRRFTFDSDQLDLISDDWSEVVELRSARSYLYVDADLNAHQGAGVITKDTVSVRTATGIVTFPREQLLSVVTSSKREIDHWSLKLSLAATARAGNTDSIDFNNYLLVRRQDALTRGTLESTANLGDLNGSRTVQNWNGTFKTDIFFHRNFYVTPLYSNGQHNSFQNLLFRGVLGGGGGVHAVDLSWLSVDLEALVAYQYTENVSAAVNTGTAFDDAVLGFGTAVEWDITSDVDFDVNWQSNLVLTEMARTYHNGSARLSVEITDIFDFDLAASLSRIEEPAADSSGVVPLPDDWTFTAGVGIELN